MRERERACVYKTASMACRRRSVNKKQQTGSKEKFAKSDDDNYEGLKWKGWEDVHFHSLKNHFHSHVWFAHDDDFK